MVTEGAAICTYLADAFPTVGLAPEPTSHLRGQYYRWMFFAAGPLEAAVTNKSLGFEVPSQRQGMAGYGNFATVMDVLEQAASTNEFLLGPKFSALDVYLGSQIGWGLLFGSIEKRPAFECYWNRIADRPAYVRAREMDDALMAARP